MFRRFRAAFPRRAASRLLPEAPSALRLRAAYSVRERRAHARTDRRAVDGEDGVAIGEEPAAQGWALDVLLADDDAVVLRSPSLLFQRSV